MRHGLIAPVRRRASGRLATAGCLLLLSACFPSGALARGAEAGEHPTAIPSGVIYTNDHVATGPWSVHVVHWSRTNSDLALHTAHAGGGAVGLSTLSEQIDRFDPRWGTPLAAVNGDYYQYAGPYAGDPRGLQIVASEVISAPNGGAAFWVDAAGQPQCTNVTSRFHVTWPDGAASPFGLNEERPSNGLVLYTAATGASTQTLRGRELILESAGEGPWLPLRLGVTYRARVREVREVGNAPLTPETMVLSMGQLVKPSSPVERGAIVRLATASTPELSGVSAAISGGPVLLRNGRVQKLQMPASEAYQFSSLLERHPRSAVGWNRSDLFLVTVDGRQKGLSVGMTLKEFASYLARLGCDEAMNLDGGGSATLWYAGKVRNSPCDRHERIIANSLVLVRRPTAPGARAGSREVAR